MKHNIGFLGFFLSALASAETYVCPAELLDEGLLQLQRSGDYFEVTHGVLGQANATIVGETSRYVCASLMSDVGVATPAIYEFCVDKKERTIGVSMGNPFADDGTPPEMSGWTRSKCFFNEGNP